MRTALFIATLLFSSAVFAHRGDGATDIARADGCRETLPVDEWIRKGCGDKSAATTQGCHESLPVDQWIKKGCGGLRSAEVPRSLYLAATNGCHEGLPVDQWIKKGCGNLKSANLTLQDRGCTDKISEEEWKSLGCGRSLMTNGKWSTSQRECFVPGASADSIGSCLEKSASTSQQASLQSAQSTGNAGR